MLFDADVIVCGAGPSGSTAAIELLKQGFSVMILEKKVFPRYKVCGAGLTPKILEIVPADIAHVIHTTIHSVRFSTNFEEVFTRSSEKPVMFCTSREEFDHLLLKNAEMNGALSKMGEQVKEIIQDNESVTVRTQSGSYRGRFFVAADGAASLAARTFGLRGDIEWGMAWEAELETTPYILEKYSETIFLDWGTFPGGYAWVFPKKDHLSAGVGGPARLSRYMPQYYRDFLGSTNIPVLKTLSNRSFPIPVKRGKNPVHNKRVVLAGDAAGLTDTLTGEGIYWAVKSGKIAAETVGNAILLGRNNLDEYSLRINREILPELNEAVRIRALFNVFPKKIHRWISNNDRVWRAFGKVLRGERSYKDVPGGFGRWKFLWGITCKCSEWVSFLFEQKFVMKQKKKFKA
jgi:geranylgeranyl reductase family protein